MEISKILYCLGIEHSCNKKTLEFNSLGLAGYNKGDRVCTFIENEKYIKELTNNIGVVLTTQDIAEKMEINDANFGVCIVEKPKITYFLIHNYLTSLEEYVGTSRATYIGENCKISDTAVISPNNVKIGDNVLIEDFVVIKENTIIGDNSIIRAGCKIGGEGFEFKVNDSATFGVKHVGGVVIGKNVEIQYNSCIDKAIYPWDDTIIGDFTKIDNLVHIGHAVKIGKRSMIVANSGIGGRVMIGDDAWIGFGAIIRNGITIGNKARINMGSVVTKSVDNNTHVSGNFAIEHDKYIKHVKEISK